MRFLQLTGHSSKTWKAGGLKKKYLKFLCGTRSKSQALPLEKKYIEEEFDKRTLPLLRGV